MIGDSTKEALLDLDRLWREMGLGYEDVLALPAFDDQPLPIAGELGRAHSASMERMVLGLLRGEVTDG